MNALLRPTEIVTSRQLVLRGLHSDHKQLASNSIPVRSKTYYVPHPPRWAPRIVGTCVAKKAYSPWIRVVQSTWYLHHLSRSRPIRICPSCCCGGFFSLLFSLPSNSLSSAWSPDSNYSSTREHRLNMGLFANPNLDHGLHGDSLQGWLRYQTSKLVNGDTNAAPSTVVASIFSLFLAWFLGSCIWYRYFSPICDIPGTKPRNRL